MTKTIFKVFIFLPLFLFSCSNDDKNNDVKPLSEPLEVTYKANCNPKDKTYMQVSYNDSQGNYIVKMVEDGWSLDVKLPINKKAFLHSVIIIKDEYIQDVKIDDCITTIQIIQGDKVVKDASGLSVNVELEP